MKIIIIIAFIYVTIASILSGIFHYKGISKFAWGYRIQKRTYINGEQEFFIQQRVPLALIWLNCVEMVGFDTYVPISFDTEVEAREYLKSLHERIKLQKEWGVKKKENIEL